MLAAATATRRGDQHILDETLEPLDFDAIASVRRFDTPISEANMANMNGTIKRLTDKGFGFISTAGGDEYFFHQSACRGIRFDELREGQPVTFDVGQGPKGPRAENVQLG